MTKFSASIGSQGDGEQTGVVPLIFNEVRLPGVAKPETNGPFQIHLAPGMPRIGRAVFEGNFPISRSAFLVFDLFAEETHGMRADIIGGDVGFASVHLVNSIGTVYRLARGNIKDFFDISRPTAMQTLRLPVSAFVFDRDLKMNVAEDGDFFSHGIVRIYFDFLRDASKQITLNLGHLHIAPGLGISLPSVQDLTIFERVGQTKMLPKFSTQSATMSLGVSLSNTGIFLGFEGFTLTIELYKGSELQQTVKIVLKQEATYFALALADLGAYTIKAKIVSGGETNAISEWPAARVRPKEGRAICGKLGISDEFNYDKIAASGGNWDRIVVSLTGVVQSDEETFRFSHGTDSIPKSRPMQGGKRVLAPFAMPRWLSRRPESPDYYRYGPSDWATYARMVRWLTAEAVNSGVTHYETWNESTALGHWADDFDVLMELHKITYEAVKSVAPEMIVLGACTHSWVYDHVDRFLREGGADYCNGLALHGYTYQPEEYLDQFDRIDGLLTSYVPHRPDFGVCITEIGFRTPAFSPEDQALYFCLYTLEAACRDRVQAILWFRYTNPRPELMSGYRQASSTGYALVGHEDSYCRPAYVSYRFMDWLFCLCDRFTVTGIGPERVYAGFTRGILSAMLSRNKEALQRVCPKDWSISASEIAGSSPVHETRLYLCRPAANG